MTGKREVRRKKQKSYRILFQEIAQRKLDIKDLSLEDLLQKNDDGYLPGAATLARFPKGDGAEMPVKHGYDSPRELLKKLPLHHTLLETLAAFGLVQPRSLPKEWMSHPIREYDYAEKRERYATEVGEFPQEYVASIFLRHGMCDSEWIPDEVLALKTRNGNTILESFLPVKDRTGTLTVGEEVLVRVISESRDDENKFFQKKKFLGMTAPWLSPESITDKVLSLPVVYERVFRGRTHVENQPRWYTLPFTSRISSDGILAHAVPWKVPTDADRRLLERRNSLGESVFSRLATSGVIPAYLKNRIGDNNIASSGLSEERSYAFSPEEVKKRTREILTHNRNDPEFFFAPEFDVAPLVLSLDLDDDRSEMENTSVVTSMPRWEYAMNAQAFSDPHELSTEYIFLLLPGKNVIDSMDDTQLYEYVSNSLEFASRRYDFTSSDDSERNRFLDATLRDAGFLARVDDRMFDAIIRRMSDLFTDIMREEWKEKDDIVLRRRQVKDSGIIDDLTEELGAGGNDGGAMELYDFSGPSDRG